MITDFDLEYLQNTNKKVNNFGFLQRKKNHKNKKTFTVYDRKYELSENLTMDQTNIQKYLLRYRDIKFYKNVECKWLKYILFINFDKHDDYENMLNITQIKELKQKPILKNFFTNY